MDGTKPESNLSRPPVGAPVEYRSIGGVPVHPAANLFDLIPPDSAAFMALVADIQKHGVRTSLKFYGESWETAQLLDGRNRLRVIQQLGMDYMRHSELLDPSDIDDPIEYVISLNLHRRHLSESQRGLIAGRVANLKNGSNQYTKEGMQICTPSTSLEEAAASLSVSRRTAASGRKVATKGTEELNQAVAEGELSVSKAATIADLPKGEQANAIQTAKVKPARLVNAGADTPCRSAWRIQDDCHRIVHLINKSIADNQWTDDDRTMMMLVLRGFAEELSGHEGEELEEWLVKFKKFEAAILGGQGVGERKVVDAELIAIAESPTHAPKVDELDEFQEELEKRLKEENEDFRKSLEDAMNAGLAKVKQPAKKPRRQQAPRIPKPKQPAAETAPGLFDALGEAEAS